MSRQYRWLKDWRKRTKNRIVDAMGGGCCICGYDRCNESLDLHHLNPDEKDFNIGSIRANARSWEKIVAELRKCVLVCRNCHGEIHAGLLEVPSNVARFNEDYTEYELIQDKRSRCSVCNKYKLYGRKYCSIECRHRGQWVVDWDSVDLYEMKIVRGLTYIEIAKEIGVSDVTVRKRVMESEWYSN